MRYVSDKIKSKIDLCLPHGNVNFNEMQIICDSKNLIRAPATKKQLMVQYMTSLFLDASLIKHPERQSFDKRVAVDASES